MTTTVVLSWRLNTYKNVCEHGSSGSSYVKLVQVTSMIRSWLRMVQQGWGVDAAAQLDGDVSMVTPAGATLMMPVHAGVVDAYHMVAALGDVQQ